MRTRCHLFIPFGLLTFVVHAIIISCADKSPKHFQIEVDEAYSLNPTGILYELSIEKQVTIQLPLYWGRAQTNWQFISPKCIGFDNLPPELDVSVYTYEDIDRSIDPSSKRQLDFPRQLVNSSAVGFLIKITDHSAEYLRVDSAKVMDVDNKGYQYFSYEIGTELLDRTQLRDCTLSKIEGDKIHVNEQYKYYLIQDDWLVNESPISLSALRHPYEDFNIPDGFDLWYLIGS